MNMHYFLTVSCRANLKYRLNKMSPNEIFLFVINPPNEKPETQKLIVKHLFKGAKK